MKTSLRTLLGAALLSVSLLGLAQNSEMPSTNRIQQSLDGLAARGLTESEQATLKARLEQTLAFLGQYQDSQKRLSSLKQQLIEAPRRTLEMQRELTRLQDSQQTPVATRYGKTATAQLESMLEDRRDQLADWQRQLGEANTQIITAQTRPERAQAQISANQQRSQQINLELKTAKDQLRPLSSEQRDLFSAEQAALEAQTEVLRQELAGNSVLQDLAQAQRDLLTERIRRVDLESQELQTLINSQRRASSEQTLAEQAKAAEQASPDSLLAKETATNLQLSDYLLQATNRLNELTQKNLHAKQQLDSLAQSEQALEEQIGVLKGSLLLAKILYQQKEVLPDLRLQAERKLTEEIADTRLYQFKINQDRDKLSNPDAYIDRLLADNPQQADIKLRGALVELMQVRLDLYERLNRELNALLSESINLQLNQRQLQSTAKTLRETIDKQLFWIPSNKPLDWAWLAQTPSLLNKQLANLPWGVTLRELGVGLVERPWVFIPLLLLSGALLWRRSWLFEKLGALHRDIGHFRRDSQLHTPLAILLNILLALPFSLLLALAGLALQLDARGQNVNLGSAFWQMAQAWLVFYTVYRILAPAGVAELHFRWPKANVTFLHTQVRRLGLVVLALVAVVTVAEHQPAELAEDVIGLGVVLVGYALMTWLLARLLLSHTLKGNDSLLRNALGLAVTLLPVGLIVAIGFGYYYTALKLTDRLIDTLYLLLLWVLLQAVIERGLTVAARRLAYQRAQNKRQNAGSKEDPEGNETVLDEHELDIEKINQQSLRLIRLTLLGLFCGSLYWVWADLLTVFTYLDNITLYQYSTGTGENLTLVPLTLLDLLGSLIIVAITIVLARNLPGLLEVLVLSRLKLAQGSAYATTTLLTYAISGLGFVVTLSVLGVSWDKLQWLVAALSVGIGFGMQEIFANFISGLIILFERPARIGDVVTIGNLSGTISRIRIRATTITDFDRKEIIVPNKTFVTDQLINWSLNDTITRVIIKIGLAYESDLELARKLMLQAARENPRVLRDPEPLLFFLTISASTFDYELRYHVRELGDRNASTDEILTRIALSFREHGVEMAFNQVDVMIKNLAGHEELNLTTGQLISSAAAAARQTQQPAVPIIKPISDPS